jgi:hypothetical protein
MLERRTELVVSVAHEESRGVAVHGSVSQLLSRPFLRGIPGRGDVAYPSRFNVDDEERVDLAEEDVVGLDKVARPNVLGLVERHLESNLRRV